MCIALPPSRPDVCACGSLGRMSPRRLSEDYAASAKCSCVLTPAMGDMIRSPVWFLFLVIWLCLMRAWGCLLRFRRAEETILCGVPVAPTYFCIFSSAADFLT